MFDLTFPVFLFGSLIALLIGALVHLIAGGKLLRLFFSMIFAWIGFWSGNYLAGRFNLDLLKYGLVNYGPALIIALIFSILGYWISGENKPEGE
jgi:hypothetical protein